MKFLYLSSFCSSFEYERIFKKYGTTSSHASHRFHKLLTRGLVLNGIGVETVTHRTIKNATEEERSEKNECVDGIKFNYIPVRNLGALDRLYTIFKACCLLNKLKKEDPQLVICTDILRGELSIATTLFKIFNKCKTIGLVTDIPNFRANEERKGIRALPYKLKNFLISRYDSYIFLTEEMNETLNSKGKPYVIIEGIVDETISEPPNIPENKYPEKVVMMAGLLEKEYGVDALLEAFHNIKTEDALLHFYGKGKSVELIKSYAYKDSRICFFGEVINSKIIEEEKKSFLLINPRPAVGEWVKYSFPSKNMEYISSGTPMLAYELPCIPKEYDGYYFKINDSLEQILGDLLNQERSKLHQFGLNAQRWILENKNSRVQTLHLVKMINEHLLK